MTTTARLTRLYALRDQVNAEIRAYEKARARIDDDSVAREDAVAATNAIRIRRWARRHGVPCPAVGERIPDALRQLFVAHQAGASAASVVTCTEWVPVDRASDEHEEGGQ